MYYDNYEIRKDMERFMRPIDEDGSINPCYADGYYKISLERKYGEARANALIEEYKRKYR